MTPLAFIFSSLLFQQPQTWPQVNPFTDSFSVREEWRRAYAKFKLGPRVAAEIEKLKAREREAFGLWQEGAISQRELSIELERAAIHRHLLMCMAFVAGEGWEAPELIVVRANHDEIRKVFPSGKLPADPLQPNQIYECEPGGKRRVRYLTLYQWSLGGAKFAVFAREVNP